MYVIGLTGSMGMGKSTTAKLFKKHGIPVYDADATVHALYQSEAVAPVRQLFPNVIENGVVSRNALKMQLQNTPQALAQLEMIMHPLVRKAQTNWMQDHHQRKTDCVALDIPLLFETGGDVFCDLVCVVSTDAERQMQRILARRTLDRAQVEALLARQMPDAKKRAKADIVIDTTHSIEDAERQVLAILQSIKEKAPSNSWKALLTS